MSDFFRNLFSSKPGKRSCAKCVYVDREHLQTVLSNGHDMARHYILTGGWDPKERGSQALGWCGKKNIAVVLAGLPCEDYDRRD